MLDDQAVAEPKALGMVEVDSTAAGRRSGYPQPGDDLIAIRKELFELEHEVGTDDRKKAKVSRASFGPNGLPSAGHSLRSNGAGAWFLPSSA